jgi:mono/diheme cytochrome c family protein
MKTSMTLGAALAGALLLLLLFLYSGFYDIGADRPHTPAVQALLGILRERSIARRAAQITLPRLDEPARVREGAEHYSAMCVGCHLSPGVSSSEIRAGLLPQPPNLSQQSIEPRVAFWVIKHGIKATGMPAWGRSHDDEEIWNIVSFVQRLPRMTPQEYRAMSAAAASEEPAGDEEQEEAHEHAPHHAHE